MAEPLGHQNLLHIRLLVNGSYLRTSQSSPATISVGQLQVSAGAGCYIQ